ncbi:40S ribosomal protein S8, putative [Medicago truncatula]|uniref:40S ribosomal protein S8, putative n=1 Tax=Medicago truncatula TaxID=3880 RepID=G7JP39_MEDTR|nr:40S ribosomal protein S8, putative [Medicago truncatula]
MFGSSIFIILFNWYLFVKVIESDALTEDQVKKSNKVQRKLEQRQKDRRLDTLIEAQFAGGRLLACISSQPGLCGRAMGNSTFWKLNWLNHDPHVLLVQY